MEKREKIEQAVKERERVRLEAIPKKWNKREEYEFLRVLTGYGVDLLSGVAIPTPDWSRFRAIAKLDRKSDEALSDYYKVFIAMCKRQANVRLTEEEKGLEGIIEDISEDHARLVLDRLELLSKLKEVGKTSINDERLLLCQNNLDTPDWWESGKHDRELIRAVMKHGLYQSHQNIFTDPEFSFGKSERAYVDMLEKQWLLAQEAEAAKLLVKTEPVKAEPTPVEETPVQEELKVAASESVKAEVETESSKTDESVESVPKDGNIVENPPADDVKPEQTEDSEKAVENSAEIETPAEEKLVEEKSDEIKSIDENLVEAKSPEKETTDEKETSAENAENNDVEMAPAEEKSADEKSSEADENPKVEDDTTKVDDATNIDDANTDVKSPLAASDEEQQPAKEAESKIDEFAEEKPSDEATAEVKSPKSPIQDEKQENIESAPVDDEPMDTSEIEATEKVEKSVESESEKEKEVSTEEQKPENDDVEMAAEATEDETVEKESPKDDEPIEKPASPKPEVELSETTDKESEKAEKDEIATETVEPIAEEDKVEDAEMKSPKPQEPVKEDELAKDGSIPEEESEITEAKSPKPTEPEQESEQQNVEKDDSVPVSVEEIKKETEIESESAEKIESIENAEPKVEPVEDVKPVLTSVKIEEKKQQDENCVTIIDDDDDVMIVGKGDPDDDEVMHEKEKASIENQNQQLAALLQKTRVKFENPTKIRWFRDFALEKRISHIVHCIEHSEWPVNKSYSAYAGCQGINLDVPLHETVKHMPPTIDLVGRSTPDLISISGDLSSVKKLQPAPVLPIPSPNTQQYPKLQMPTIPTGGKKRKRHIAIDVETERAKLHALLNSSQDSIPGSAPQTPVQNKQMNWPTDDEPKPSKRSLSAMQPPPAHQHLSHMPRTTPNQQQQQQQQQVANYSTKSQIIPGTSSTLTPIDLSSSLIKPMKDLSKGGGGGIMDLSEVQDFSISKKSSNSSPFGAKGGKLDDMLTKLMKKNNYVSFVYSIAISNSLS